MSRKKNRGDPPLGTEPEDAPPKPLGPLGTSLAGLLKGIEIAKPNPAANAKSAPFANAKSAPLANAKSAPRTNAKKPLPAPELTPSPSETARPSESLKGHDRTAYLDALAGVRPIRGRLPPRIGAIARPAAPPSPEESHRDEEARARLAALVAGGVRFDVVREDGWIEGLRHGAKRALIAALRRSQIAEDATLDLHGLRAPLAQDRLARFLRDAQRAGLRRVRIVHGKGTHSEGGVGVLADVVVRTLSEGAGAPRVLAFVTAPSSQGGEGALLVELAR